MRKLVIVSLLSGTISVIPAMAADTYTTPIQGGGTVERKHDVDQNPLTGSTTEEDSLKVKNAQGDTISSKTTSVKKNKKGQLIRKKTTEKQMNADGDTVMEQKVDEKIDR